MFFYIQDNILMAIFYTFIFVKEMHVDFYITKGTLILYFAWHFGCA